MGTCELSAEGVPSVDALTNLRTVGFFNLLESDVDSLEALAGLESAGGVQIASSHSLTDLRGLGGLRRLPHGLLLTDNSAKPLEALLRDAKTTAFDVANAITATARERRTAPRLGLEETAHRYLVGRTAA